MNWRTWWARLREIFGAEAGAQGRRGVPRAFAGRGRPGWFPADGLAGLRPVIDQEEPLRQYDAMRRRFPVLEVALGHLVRLVGRLEVETRPGDVAEWQRWLERVPVNHSQRGLQAWLETHLDSYLVYGFAVGEIVPDSRRRDVFALFNLDSRAIRFRASVDPLALEILQQLPGRLEPVTLNRALTLLSVRNPQHDSPYGVSLFRSLPQAAEACSIIENATIQAWMRMGNPSFHINWKSGPEFADARGDLAGEVTAEMQARFHDAMSGRLEGDVRDFVTFGDVSVSTIGSGTHLMAIREPIRVFLEQMVSATGLPPWLLGLHWATTERLSVQQADLLVATIEAIRRAVEPQLQYLVDLRQQLRGERGTVRLRWSAIDLRDLVEQARAALIHEQARQGRIENARRMAELGYWTEERAAREAEG